VDTRLQLHAVPALWSAVVLTMVRIKRSSSRNRSRILLPERKVPISLRMDREVVEWLKASGRRYQSRMNAVPKAYVRAQRMAG